MLKTLLPDSLLLLHTPPQHISFMGKRFSLCLQWWTNIMFQVFVSLHPGDAVLYKCSKKHVLQTLNNESWNGLSLMGPMTHFLLWNSSVCNLDGATMNCKCARFINITNSWSATVFLLFQRWVANDFLFCHLQLLTIMIMCTRWSPGMTTKS